MTTVEILQTLGVFWGGAGVAAVGSNAWDCSVTGMAVLTGSHRLDEMWKKPGPQVLCVSFHSSAYSSTVSTVCAGK